MNEKINSIIHGEETFGILLKKNGDEYIYDSVCKINYSNSTVKEFFGDKKIGVLSSYDFFVGNPEYIFNCKGRVKISISNNVPGNYALFPFELSFIKHVCEQEKINFENALKLIALRSTEVLLKQDENNYYLVEELINNKDEEDIDDIDLNEALKYYNNYKEEKFNNNQLPFIAVILNTLAPSEEEELEEEEEDIKEKESPASRIKKLDKKKIISDISKKIVGQENAIKTLVTNICFIQDLIDYVELNDEDPNELDSRKPAILLDGSTGTGKTAIAKEIADIFDLPFEIVNANSFSETGYVGPTITDMLSRLLDTAHGDINLASRGIVVIDEVDKIAESNSTQRSMKLGVQKELLGFISGSKYDIKYTTSSGATRKIVFDTSKLTFILSGAFTDIKEKKIKDNEKKGLGFNSDRAKCDRSYIVTPQDYINYGLMREFFGRIKILATTKTYSVEDLKTILLESTISPLKGFEDTCIMYGYPGITYSDEFLDAVVNKAYEMGTGARALQNLMSGIQDVLLYYLITGKLDKSKPVELNSELLDKYSKRNIRKY